ncbi:ASCH domain-containing protein [Marinobacter sp. bablab_jr008]|uniref:ASCH domain-containing protein n=1 Tax=Marinobacter sp. bablab_jr008 TaxID=2755064 RepID=UPI0018F23067|nr:ASCH domain-containing protein [Marinobacter sp. bablab_jr008]MEC9386070.1 ASCH domain-containing protein [Pseudomonadota bacterium]
MPKEKHELNKNWEAGAKPITRGLIIDQPWIDKILKGYKTWEMRSARTTIRGPIALIEKGSGTIVGVGSILDSIGPLCFEEVFENEIKHNVGPEIYTRDGYKWNHAWVLGDVLPLVQPIKYQHRSGAVVWVELDTVAIENLQAALVEIFSTTQNVGSRSKSASAEQKTSKIPYARDGSSFCINLCNKNGYFTVGEKGSEQRFSNYSAALEYLKRMPTAKWRRPNLKGNWGIVSAIGWQDATTTTDGSDSRQNPVSD